MTVNPMRGVRLTSMRVTCGSGTPLPHQVYRGWRGVWGADRQTAKRRYTAVAFRARHVNVQETTELVNDLRDP